MPSYLHMRCPKPDTDRDPFVRMILITRDNYTGKSSIAATTHLAAKFRTPPVKLSWMNVCSARNLRHNRIGCKRASHKVDLRRLAPPTTPLRAAEHSNLPQ